MSRNSDSRKALQRAIEQIERQFGKGAIMTLGGAARAGEVPHIPTGILSVDHALGVGGFPRGRVVEVYGPESSGKTTLALQVVGQVHRMGGVAAFVDAEHALDAEWAARLGVKVDDLLVSQPDTGEQALEIADMLVRSGSVDIIVVDSVAALVPKAELEGDIGDSHVGLQARLMSQALRKLTGVVSKSRTCLVFINQLREKVGVMFGNPEVTPGGRALKFYSSLRLEVRRVSTLTEGDAPVGNRVRLKVAKNKLAPPFRRCQFTILFREGIDVLGDLVELAVEEGVVKKSGSWYSYGETRLGQGLTKVKAFLRENPEVREEVEGKVRAALGLQPGGGEG